MTEENFFDKFNRIHNPKYYYDKSKTKKKKKTTEEQTKKEPLKEIPVTVKA